MGSIAHASYDAPKKHDAKAHCFNCVIEDTSVADDGL